MTNLSQEVATNIQDALNSDQLDLPSLPEVALEIRDVAESDTVSSVSLGKVVGKDPGLAAQLVRIANSPMFRATRSIDDLVQAISRLGVEYAANIVTGLAMQQMFQATSDLIDKKLRAVWKQSTDVASWSSILCKRYTSLRPDQATLAGLTHCIGILPILSWVEEHDHVVRDSMTLDRVIETLHPTIGTMILNHWNFPEEICKVAGNYQNLTYANHQPDYVDLVQTANLMRLLGSDHPVMDEAWQSAGSFTRLELDPNMDELDFAELEQEVADVKDVFR